MQQPKFTLNNEQRKYLGLDPINDNWEIMQIGERFYYFDGDIIKREIVCDVEDDKITHYAEYHLNITTAENRTLVLPKTSRGKPKKLNFSTTQTFKTLGVYFRYEHNSVVIANMDTQQTFYKYPNIINQTPYNSLQDWLNDWIENSNQNDLLKLTEFKNQKRQHQKYKEGDIFAIKVDKNHYVFGKILIDVRSREKDQEFIDNKNYGLTNLMGKALIVKIYHKISDTLNVDIDELDSGLAMPADKCMDNRLYYGEYPIIGHRAVRPDEFDDMIISHRQSISSFDPDVVYLQYGFIYKELPKSHFNKYTGFLLEQNPYENESIGHALRLNPLQQCIKDKSNASYYHDQDLRNPKLQAIKNEIFAAFGLNGNLGYVANYELYLNAKNN